jgi:hypothetical protein
VCTSWLDIATGTVRNAILGQAGPLSAGFSRIDLPNRTSEFAGKLTAKAAVLSYRRTAIYALLELLKGNLSPELLYNRVQSRFEHSSQGSLGRTGCSVSGNLP